MSFHLSELSITAFINKIFLKEKRKKKKALPSAAAVTSQKETE
jgi:hypothetical protein